MASPLAVWLRQQKLRQAELAALANVDRTDVCRMASGQVAGNRKLRAFLAKVAPDVLRQQDEYRREWMERIRRQILEGGQR